MIFILQYENNGFRVRRSGLNVPNPTDAILLSHSDRTDYFVFANDQGQIRIVERFYSPISNNVILPQHH